MNNVTKTVKCLREAATAIKNAQQELLAGCSESDAPQALYNVYEDIGDITGDIEDAIINTEHLEHLSIFGQGKE